MYFQCHLVDLMSQKSRAASALALSSRGMEPSGGPGLNLVAFSCFHCTHPFFKLLIYSKLQVEKTMGGKGSLICLQCHSASTLYLVLKPVIKPLCWFPHAYPPPISSPTFLLLNASVFSHFPQSPQHTPFHCLLLSCPSLSLHELFSNYSQHFPLFLWAVGIKRFTTEEETIKYPSFSFYVIQKHRDRD